MPVRWEMLREREQEPRCWTIQSQAERRDRGQTEESWLLFEGIDTFLYDLMRKSKIETSSAEVPVRRVMPREREQEPRCWAFQSQTERRDRGQTEKSWLLFEGVDTSLYDLMRKSKITSLRMHKSRKNRRSKYKQRGGKKSKPDAI